ncbi:hypothetical protein I4F81_010754 [Pyropia yezoensis]|uniref:Uncharacterized protein n=1 Tax=Pyropia yezoensis TaxID=2788 RepID=A0ACC3CDB6_PYRYE|nr:hypothetical protein I4F81_010754 [Neopyropia yezoensis]
MGAFRLAGVGGPAARPPPLPAGGGGRPPPFVDGTAAPHLHGPPFPPAAGVVEANWVVADEVGGPGAAPGFGAPHCALGSWAWTPLPGAPQHQPWGRGRGGGGDSRAGRGAGGGGTRPRHEVPRAGADWGQQRGSVGVWGERQPRRNGGVSGSARGEGRWQTKAPGRTTHGQRSTAWTPPSGTPGCCRMTRRCGG